LLYESKSFGDSASIFVQEAPFALNVGENLNLQIFVDRCMVEVFANGRQALCMQVYPIREDSLGIRFRAQNGNAKITRLQAWQMNNADEAEHNQ
jgi:sucrose-6-phosphate hydrolase SacC (GH32 family)